jgi:hypothetical protein
MQKPVIIYDELSVQHGTKYPALVDTVCLSYEGEDAPKTVCPSVSSLADKLLCIQHC